MSKRSNGSHKTFWITALVTFAAWLGFAALVVPALIGSAYRGESVGFLNRLITGQAVHPLESYLATWSRLAGYLTIALACLFLALFVVLAAELWRHPGRWATRLLEREGALKGRPPRLQPGGYWLVLMWCGLIAGLWETLYLSKKMLFGEWLAVHMATNVTSLWMAPLGYAMIFGLVGAILYVLARLRPGWLTLKWVVVGGIFVAVFSIGRSTASRPELYGVIPFAAGVAVLSGRLASAWSDRFMRFVRRSVPVGFVLIAILAVGIEVQQRIVERRALSRLPEAAAGAPNVLLIILDTVRSKSMSLYGYERPTTPNLERLAERGVVFQHAVATAPWTLPTHASVFTGRHHHELTVNWTRPLDDSDPTLAEYLRDNGYTTAGFVANFYYCGPQFGLHRGFIRYQHQPIRMSSIINSSWLGRELRLQGGKALGNHQKAVRKTAAEVNREFLDWQAGVDPPRPFFAFLNYFDAHSPYLPPEPYDMRFSRKPRYWLKDEGDEYTADELRELTDAYDNSIAYLDEQLGVLFDELEAQGVLDNTLVIITSDHGEQFGEHGLMYHSNSLYMPLLHVPLLISFPAHLPAAVRVEDPVSLRDIAATVVDLLALSASPFPGRSIAGYWNDRPGVTIPEERSIVLSEITANRRIPDWEPAAYGPMQSLVEGRLHYIRRGDGAEELFDWLSDPNETTNLIDSEVGRARVRELRARLEAVLLPDPDGGAASNQGSVGSASGGGSSSR